MLLAASVAVSVPIFEGDDGPSEERQAVTAYIVEVNTTQQALVVELERLRATYAGLKLTGDPPPGQRAKVDRGVRTLVRIKEELSALRPPLEARALHAELLGLLDMQIAFAGEIATMVRYLPLQAATGRALAAATRTLRAGLRGAGTGAAQQQIFLRYAAAAGAAREQLADAEAPAVLQPAQRGEVARLERLASLARRIAAALKAQRAADVDRLFAAFARTSAAVGTTTAERRAVIAFNRRLRAIGKQRTAVELERRQLATRLS